MDKHCDIPGRTRSGAPLIHVVEASSAYGLNKVAGMMDEHLPQVRELVESLKPSPGRLYLVNAALGAGEYVGSNMRGDLFSEKALLHTPPGWEKIPVWDIESRRRAAAEFIEDVPGYGPRAWGYPTFMNARRFRNHMNKDPKGAHGYILGAFYDHRMHRVVLVSELIESLCAELGSLDIYRRIERGEFVDTSMGANVPYDVCTICGFQARTPNDYCEHVRADALPPYGMNALLADGRRCAVWNPQPRFFDDSYVIIGAERSAKVMADVTSRVRGNREYSDRLYPAVHGAPSFKAASLTGVAPTEEERVDEALVEDIAKTRALDSRTSGQRLSRILLAPRRPAPVAPQKREDNRERIELLTRDRTPVEVPKTSGIKLSDMFKQIPAPSREQLSLVRDAECVPEMDRSMLTQLGPGGLSALTHLGVILSPREFQYANLRPQNASRAEELWESGDTFAPSFLPKDFAVTPTPVPDADTFMRIRHLLGNLLHGRNLGGHSIRITIEGGPLVKHASLAEEPLLQYLYHQYRAEALAAHFVRGEKTAGLCTDSLFLFALAHWGRTLIEGA